MSLDCSPNLRHTHLTNTFLIHLLTLPDIYTQCVTQSCVYDHTYVYKCNISHVHTYVTYTLCIRLCILYSYVYKKKEKDYIQGST